MAQGNDDGFSPAMHELAALVGTTPDRLVLTDELIRRIALEQLAQLAYKGRRGCRQSAQYLVSQHLGEPSQTLLSRVHTMSCEEAKDALFQEYLAEGHNEDEARRLVSMAERAAELKAKKAVEADTKV